MKRELTFFELIRLLMALLAGVILYLYLMDAGDSFAPDLSGLVGMIVYLFFAVFMPPLLTILLACLLPSWRYRTITATLLLMGATVWYALDFFFVSEWMELVGVLIRLSAGMSGALAGVLIWQRLKEWQMGRTKPVSATIQPAAKMPRSSIFLLSLSLVSIPATYITIFASAFLVVGYSAVLMLGLFELPQIPVFLIAAAVLAPLVALWAALRALVAIFRPQPPFQPALVLDMGAHPQTNRMIDELCTAIKTRTPDNVLLHAEPTFFVSQHKMATFDGTIKGRTLALGMPLLSHLTGQELKAILAHEFAHFSGRDTLYSTWVSQIHRGLGESILRVRQGMANSEGWFGLAMNILLLPALLFLTVFYQFFASIDSIISRTRELRADWIAAQTCGNEAFASALQKVIQYATHFSKHQEKINPTSETGVFQQVRLLAEGDGEQLQSYLDEAMQEPEYEYASHPTLGTRIQSVPTSVPTQIERDDAFRSEFAADEERLSKSMAEILRQIQAFHARSG